MSLPEPPDPLAGLHLLLVVNVDWFFLSHRLPIARAARAAGMHVTVAAGDTGCGDRIRAEGLEFVPMPLSRQGRRAVDERAALAALAQLYRRQRPSLLHHVTIKPVVYGSLVARAVLPGTPVVNALSGLGFTFTAEGSRGPFAKGVRALYRVALRHPGSTAVFQNEDDRSTFVRAGLVRRERTVIVRGSGVDLDRFRPGARPEQPPIVVLPARLLRHKGVAEFVAAARLVRASRPDVRFVLVGGPDVGNPTSIAESEVRAWLDEGAVEWWGHQDDMAGVFARATVAVLPSYREGLPKALLEAAAAGLPMVATDVPGCREIVRDRETGLLVPLGDIPALASAVLDLVEDPERAERLGTQARRVAEAEFGDRSVAAATLEVYRSALGARTRAERR